MGPLGKSIHGKSVGNPLLLQLPAEAACQPAAKLKKLLLIVPLIFRVQHHRYGGIRGVIVLFYHQSVVLGTAGPGYHFHGFPPGIFPKAQGQHRVFEYKAADGYIPQIISQQLFPILLGIGLGKHHNLPQRLQPAALFRQSQEISAIHFQVAEEIAAPLLKAQGDMLFPAFPGAQPKGSAGIGCATVIPLCPPVIPLCPGLLRQLRPLRQPLFITQKRDRQAGAVGKAKNQLHGAQRFRHPLREIMLFPQAFKTPGRGFPLQQGYHNQSKD